MGIRPQSEGRTRFAQEGGYIGRRRHYRCRVCGDDFIHDGNRLSEPARVCGMCRLKPGVNEQIEADLNAMKGG